MARGVFSGCAVLGFQICKNAFCIPVNIQRYLGVVAYQVWVQRMVMNIFGMILPILMVQLYTLNMQFCQIWSNDSIWKFSRWWFRRSFIFPCVFPGLPSSSSSSWLILQIFLLLYFQFDHCDSYYLLHLLLHLLQLITACTRTTTTTAPPRLLLIIYFRHPSIVLATEVWPGSESKRHWYLPLRLPSLDTSAAGIETVRFLGGETMHP